MEGTSFYRQATKKLAQGQWKALPFTVKPQKVGPRAMESTSFYRQAEKSRLRGNGWHFLLPSSHKKMAQG